jgi:hypothetical protein
MARPKPAKSLAKKSSSIHVEAVATLTASQRLAGLEPDDELSSLKIEFDSHARWVTITYRLDETQDDERAMSLPAEHALKIPALLRELEAREKIFSPIDAVEEFVDVGTPAAATR